jgi:hypothetical protein
MVNWDEIIEEAYKRGDYSIVTPEIHYLSQPAQDYYVSQFDKISGCESYIRLFRKTLEIDENENQ